ncbi:MAG: MerR family transcriptional regulator [Candidatus Ancillula sp.]|jgi:DNA-binding transcriptional MerR regulator|nr:MerR family transcriptional regulator [Candidatus Ancillula sp.]
MRDPNLHNVTETAKIAGIHPQTLRHYEKVGLVIPQRTKGGVRRYTDLDIKRLQYVRSLAERGVNLEGIGIIMKLQEENNILKREVVFYREKNNVFQADEAGQIKISPQNMSLKEQMRYYRQRQRQANKKANNILNPIPKALPSSKTVQHQYPIIIPYEEVLKKEQQENSKK